MTHPIDILLPMFRVGAFFLGITLLFATLLSVVRTLVLPRAASDWISRSLLRGMWKGFNLYLRKVDTYEERDRLMAFFAPTYLLTLLPLWLTLLLFGYMGMFWAVRPTSWLEAFLLSGSSLLTLGFAPVYTLPEMILCFSEAVAGLILVALLIAYLPSMYGNFSRRESAVTELSVRAGTPPSAVEMISRMHRIGELDRLRDFWEEWEHVFAEIEESHSSFAALVFFRSPNPKHSWVTATGIVMDTAAILLSVVDIPNEPKAAICIGAGFLALQRIGDFFEIEFDPTASYPQNAMQYHPRRF